MRMWKGLLSTISALIFFLAVMLPAGAESAESLAQVVEGAKKEGTVFIKTVHGFTEKSMYRLEQGIKDKYGVALKIKYTGATNFNKDIAQAVMEQKTGAVPAYDMLSLSNHVSMANKAGVLEQVDWLPLLSEGTNPAAVHDNPLMRGAIVYTTAHFGLMYNPKKVKPDEVPRKLADLADPKWKNKVAIETQGSASVRWAYKLGIEKTLDTYRRILQNGAIHGMSNVQYNRFMIEEIWFARVSSTFMGNAIKQGASAAWQSQDFSDISEFSAVIRKGAAHPNAAKLVALYLASWRV